MHNKLEIRMGRGRWRWLAAIAALGAALMGAPAHADFVNGDFETTGDPIPGWTATGYRNNGIPAATFPPTKFSDLNLVVTPANLTFTFANGQHQHVSQPDNDPNRIKVPFGGAYSGHVNGDSTTVGNRITGQKATGISQTITIAPADVSPSDGLVHVRMKLAPVLIDPAHQPRQQPYFYVEVVNETKGTTAYSMFNFASQPGVAWQAMGSYRYTNWQTIDAPVPDAVAGDRVTVRIVAAGCSLGAHGGDLYVDDVTTGATAGLSISATGPASAVPDSAITYTYTYNNDSPSGTTGTKVTIVSPQVPTQGAPGTLIDLPFTSLNVPAGWTCTPPAAGTPGTVVCDVGDVPAGGTGSFKITWNIPNNASTTPPNNVVGHGNYNIEANNVPRVSGPLVNTTLLPAGTADTDLEVTITDGVTTLAPNASTSYTIVVTNHGPTAVTGAPLTQVSSGVTLGAWTCVASGSASCSAASGSGPLSGVTVNLAAGETIIITQAGTAGASDTTDTRISVAAPAAVPDRNLANNSAQDVNTIEPVAVVEADLGVTVTDGVTTLAPNDETTYTIVVTNNGPTDVTGASLTQVSSGVNLGDWTCVATGGASCSAASGTGPLSGVTVDIPSGGSVTFTQKGIAGAAGTTDTRVTVTAPTGVSDPNPNNNSAQDVNTIGAAAGSGAVTPVPTLGVWSLSGLAALLMLLGARRQRAA